MKVTNVGYIDDFGGLHKYHAGANNGYERCQDLMHELGLQEATSKCSPPSTTMVWLGVTFNTVDMTMSIPTHKIEEVLRLCLPLQSRLTMKLSELRSLLGKLFHTATCSNTLRLFVNRMLETLRTAVDTCRDEVLLSSKKT